MAYKQRKANPVRPRKETTVEEALSGLEFAELKGKKIRLKDESTGKTGEVDISKPLAELEKNSNKNST